MNSPRRQIRSFSRGWPEGQPSLLAILIIANVVCYLAQAIIGHFVAPGLMERWFALSWEGLRAGCFWQLGTYMFLHGGPWHLLVNMLMLYFAGREVESILGRKHLLAIYFGGGLLGAIGHLVFTDAGVSIVGASAGVFAVLVAFATILPELEVTLLLFFVIPLRMKAKFLAMGLVGVSAFFILSGASGNIAHIAHLGGALLGWVYVKQLGFGNPLRIQRYIFEKRQRDERRERMTPAQFINEEIDPILDKISREGMHSLTRAERRILEKGREKIAKKASGR